MTVVASPLLSRHQTDTNRLELEICQLSPPLQQHFATLSQSDHLQVIQQLEFSQFSGNKDMTLCTLYVCVRAVLIF